MDDYKVLKVKLNEDTKSCHHLFYKQHKLKRSEADGKDNTDVRTLFVNNVPPYFSEQGLKNAFSCFGKVDSVVLYSKPSTNPFKNLNQSNLSAEKPDKKAQKQKTYFHDTEEEEDNPEKERESFKIAYVLFNQASSIEKAMKKPNDSERTLCTNNENAVNTGMKKWIEEYKDNFVDARQLLKEIDEYMKSYDELKEKQDQEELENLNQPDEDGWITVTSKNKKANLALTERNIQKIKLKQKRKRQQMQLVNFYSFQMKESKKEYIAQLRKKFEEDKKRIETMKQNRKFKPF